MTMRSITRAAATKTGFTTVGRGRGLGAAASLTALFLASGCNNTGDKSSETQTTSATQAQAPVTPAAKPAEGLGVTKVPDTTTVKSWQSRLNKDMKSVIDELASLGGKPIETLTPAEARQQPTPADAVKALLTKEGKSTKPEEVAKVENRTVSLTEPSGAVQVPIRIYTPKKGKAPYPVIVYYHGGGFVIANNDVYDASPRALANAASAVVVAVDYREAPEHKFPAAHDDAFAAYRWALKNTASFGGDASKVAVAGESAGGNLAASVSIAARDAGEKLPVHELLVYPVASSDTNAASYLENADAKPLNKAMMGWFTTQYFRTPADGQDPRINLVSANLKGLPRTTIVNAEIDPLRSDGETLAMKLKEAGVPVEQKTYLGVTHEFFGMGAAVSDAKDAVDFAATRLKKDLGG